MWLVVAVAGAVLVWVWWQALGAWWRRSSGCFPLLLVLLKDRAEAAEGFLRALLRLLGWRGSAPAWEVVVVDTGSRDETPAIARRVLKRTGVVFLEWGEEPGLVGEVARDASRPILVLPLTPRSDSVAVLAQAAHLLGERRIPVPGGELQDSCKAGLGR